LSKYKPSWDLSTIPHEAIPDELLKHWWSLRTNAIKGKKEVDDPKHREFLDKRAEYMRQRRAEQKAAEEKPQRGK
jgi:hypothetical protein